MSELRDFCDKLWNGEIDTTFQAHPVMTAFRERRAEEIDDGILYYKGFASSTTVDSGDGLVMLDTGAMNDAAPIYDAVRAWRPQPPLAAAVFSHHHVDHIFGVAPFDHEAAERRLPRPRVYGHELLGSHFDRYKRMTGWNGAINRRQFMLARIQADAPTQWPDDYRYPDVAYRDAITFRAGGLTFHLHHARGETDDATWTWVPERKLLFTGDLFIWAVPNAGNPQKVQRYVGEWAAALRRMAALDAELMVPGHGWPVFGPGRVRATLTDAADLLQSIEDQAVALMNAGATLDTVLHSVELPQHLLDKPYLRPVYDHPQFLIRTVWRLYGGWYDGEPDNLLPAPRRHQAREWVALAGGLDRVLERANQLKDEDARLACHVIEYAVLAEPSSAEAHALRAEIYDARAALQTALMSRGIFTFAAASSRLGKRDALEPLPDAR